MTGTSDNLELQPSARAHERTFRRLELHAWHIRCFVPKRTTRLAHARSLARLARWFALVLAFSGCASIPKQRYGIERLSFIGMKELDPNALRACLTTEQRSKVTLGLGALSSADCGEPPFDSARWQGRLFALPWTAWPVYDEAVFKLDVERIERWYQARGYYGVRVLDVKFKPHAARTADVCKSDDPEQCEIEIEVHIEEGEPVKLRKVELDVEGKLDPKLVERIYSAIALEKGDVFDEKLYDDAREELADVLREAGYARAAVVGQVTVNRGLLVADITFTITPGPLCHFGDVRVTSRSKIPEEPVLAATLLRKGQLYQESELDDAQKSIYALGAFSAVTVRGDLEHSEGAEIPVLIEVEPRRESQWLVGAGIMSGISQTGAAAQEGLTVPQWDVHLLGSYENRNFMGGLRRFHVEERPRMLFLSQFPGVPDNSPRFGNTISADFSQPGVIDGRTNLFVETRWDNGPDPFLLFFRNDIGVALGLDRGFWRQRLQARLAIHQEIQKVARRQPITDDLRRQLEARWQDQWDNQPEGARRPINIEDRQAIIIEEQSSYVLPFIEQHLSLDLRDDGVKPTTGAYFRITAQEAFQLPDTPSWNYLRLTPEARVYAPLGLGIVLAARFAIGWLHVFDASNELDQVAQRLGAQSYRLRGGGAQSNRGFMPGRLGDSRLGGTHRWEGSLELRVPIARDFYIVGFGDVGDVNSGLTPIRQYDGGRPEGQYSSRYEPRAAGFRFDHLNTTLGGGLRYYTVIGAVRLDVGYRPTWARWKDSDDQTLNLGFTKFRGAIHITIGDSF